MSHVEDDGVGLKATLTYPISLFAIVGVGVGLTAAILMSVLGGDSAIMSGIILLVTIAVSLLLGPIVATIIGIQMSDRERTGPPVGSILGCSFGFIVMMATVLLLVFIGVAITSTGGGTGAGGGAGTPTQGGGLDVSEYLLPIILVTIPTGLVGGAASSLQGKFGPAGDVSGSPGSSTGIDLDIPKRYAVGGAIGVLVVSGVAFGGMALLSSPADNFEVAGEGYSEGTGLYASAAVTNPGDEAAPATLTIRFKIDGAVKDSFTAGKKITVGPGETVEKSFKLGSYNDLSSSEKEALENGDFTIEFLIDGDVKDTYTES